MLRKPVAHNMKPPSDIALRAATMICTLDEYEESGLGRDDIQRLARTIDSAGVLDLIEKFEITLDELQSAEYELSQREST